MKDILRMVVVLGAICLVAGLVLAGVNQATKGPIEYQKLLVKAKSLKQVLSGYDNDPVKDSVKIPAGPSESACSVATGIPSSEATSSAGEVDPASTTRSFASRSFR